MKRLAVWMLLLCLADLAQAAKIARPHKPKQKPSKTELTEATIAKRQEKLFSLLRNRFPKDREAVEMILNDERLAFDCTLIPGKCPKPHAAPPEKKVIPYSYLFQDEMLERAHRVLEQKSDVLRNIAAQYHFPAHVPASYEGAESGYGKFTGTRPVINTLYTLAIWRKSEKGRRWAVNELVAFLDICFSDYQDPYLIIGSTTGAFGLTQFEPTSVKPFARYYDGEKCVKPESVHAIDLFIEENALCSTANYIAMHGYGPAYRQRYAATHSYNHEKAYVLAVLAFANVLAGGPIPVYYRPDLAPLRTVKAKDKPKAKRTSPRAAL